MSHQDKLEELEEEIFLVLQDAFHRQECAAKAAARLELEIVDRHLDEREEPTKADDEEGIADVASQASREFNADQFLSIFSSANSLRLVNDVFSLLGLEELEEEVDSVMIRDLFQSRSSSGKQVGRSSGEETFIGSDKELMLHNLRRAAERAQRSSSR